MAPPLGHPRFEECAGGPCCGSKDNGRPPATSAREVYRLARRGTTLASGGLTMLSTRAASLSRAARFSAK